MSKMGMWAFMGLFLLPFLPTYHMPPVHSFLNEWLAGLLAVLALSIFLTRRDDLVEVPYIALAPLAVTGVLILQAALSMPLYDSQVRLAVIYLLLVAVSTVITRALAGRIGQERLVRLIAWSILVGGMLNATSAILQYWDWQRDLYWLVPQMRSGRAYGSIAQPNQFACYVALSMGALAYLHGKKAAPAWLMAIFGLVLTLALFLSGSRTIWLYLFGLLAAALLCWRKVDSLFGRRAAGLSLLMLSAGAALYVALSQGGAETAGQAARVGAIANESTYIRLHMWKQSWDMFLSAPLLGVGYQNYAWAHFLYLVDHPNPIWASISSLYAESPHNIVFELLAQFGLLGAVILIGIAYWIVRGFRQVRDVEQWAVLTLFGLLSIYSLLEYPHRFLHFLLPAAIFLALMNGGVIRLRVSSNLVRMLAAASMAVSLSLLAMIHMSYARLDQLFNDKALDTLPMGETIRGKIAWAKVGDYFEQQVDEYTNNFSIVLNGPAALAYQREVSERVMRFKTTDRTVYRHIFLLGANGEYEEALGLIEKASRAYPHSMHVLVDGLERIERSHPETQNIGNLLEVAKTRMLSAQLRSSSAAK